MAGTNNFLAVATGAGANVITQSAYAALTTFLANGYSSGVVASNQFNKIIRQSSFMAAAIGQLVANANINALDDGDVSGFADDIAEAIKSFAAPPAGAVIYVAKNTAPTGYIKANGAAISRSTYSALFTAIGTTFGSGDGSTTFNVPDLRGEFLRGWDDSRGIDSARVFGSAQAATAFLSYVNNNGELSITNYDSSASAGTQGIENATITTSPAVTSYTVRPRNVALLACIKY